MKVVLDIEENGSPTIRFSKVVGSNSTDQKILERFIVDGLAHGLYITNINEEKEPLEKGEKREYEIRINKTQ